MNLWLRMITFHNADQFLANKKGRYALLIYSQCKKGRLALFFYPQCKYLSISS